MTPGATVRMENTITGLLTLLTLISSSAAIEVLNQEGCKVTTDRGVMDLSSLKDMAKFANISTDQHGDDVIDYNPCSPLKEEGDCKDAAVCLHIGKQARTPWNYGMHSSETFVPSETGGLNLIYSAEEGKPTSMRKTEVKLTCSNEEKPTVVFKSMEPVHLKLELKSKLCCLSDLPPTGADPSEGLLLSTGTYLLITFFSAMAFYIIFGYCCNICCRGFYGKEAIPHFEFWKELPYLARDGILFSCPTRLRSNYKLLRGVGFTRVAHV